MTADPRTVIRDKVARAVHGADYVKHGAPAWDELPPQEIAAYALLADAAIAAHLEALEQAAHIETVADLDALPERALIWYSITWDSVRIHALMQKLDGRWIDATNPDDEHWYTPALPARVLYRPEETP